MFTIHKYHRLKSIEKEWKYLYDNNPCISPFQDYDYLLQAIKNYWYYYISQKCYITYWLIKNDNEPILIAPILHHLDGRRILFTHQNGYNYCDFIYKDLSYINDAINFLTKQIGTIEAYNINNTMTIKALHQQKKGGGDTQCYYKFSPRL